jgi:hypothetical protein
MLLTIVSIWAIVIPVAILGVSWQAAKIRDARASQTAGRPVPELGRGTSPAGGVPVCAVPGARPRRTLTRRVCPERPRGAGRRPASAS